MANLWTAASDGDVERVKYLLSTESSSGLNVNSADENGYTIMHAAASWGHADLLRSLVQEYKGDINIADNDGDTPLFTVETLDMCKLVLELGGDPTLVDQEGLTPARFLFEDHEEIARYLASLTGEELPAVASTSSIPMDADGDTTAEDRSSSLSSDIISLQNSLQSASQTADPQSLDEASQRAAIETNARAGNLLSQVQAILLEADRTGEDPEARIRAVVDQAVRGTMQAGRGIAEMQVEQEHAQQQQQQEQLPSNGTTKRQRREDEPQR